MQIKSFCSLLLTAASCGSAFAAAPPATSTPRPDAEDSDRLTVAEVVVTAQRRSESSQAVPVALNTLSASDLENIGFSNVADLKQRVPALQPQVFNYSSNVIDLRMRGVGSLQSMSTSNDPAVGLYIDDVYIARTVAMTMDLADIERVEVLRGPQGALYGRNTTGGAVKIVSAAPTGELGITESIDAGNYGSWRTLTNLNVPEYKSLSLKLTYLRSGFDGYVENSGTGGNFGQREQEGVRVAARWRPVDVLTVDYAYDHATQSDGVPNYLTDSLQRVDRASRPIDTPMADNFTTSGHALTINWDLTDRLSVKSVSSYRELTQRAQLDTNGAFYGLPIIGYMDENQHQASEELLLSGNAPELGLQYTAGALYFTESGQNGFGTFVGGTRFPQLGDTNPGIGENKSYGFFAHVTWTPKILERRLDISAGGRASWDERTAAGGTVVYSIDEASSNSFDPSLSLDYRWTEDLHTYVKYARAYRTGGFSQFDSQLREFAPEQVTSYEAGIKADLFQRRLRFNLNVFHEDYEDMQVAIQIQDPACPLACSFTTNAASISQFDGVEGEMEAVPFEGFHWYANYAYLNTRGDVAFTNAPRWSYSTGADYTFEPFKLGTLMALVDYSYDGDQIGAVAGRNWMLGSRGLLNARLALNEIRVGSSEVSVALYVKNVADKEYLTFSTAGAFIYGPPRTYGLNVRVKI